MAVAEDAIAYKGICRHIIFDQGEPLPEHPNGMVFDLIGESGEVLLTETYFSIGGGFISTLAEMKQLVAPLKMNSAVSCPHPFDTARSMLQEVGSAAAMAAAGLCAVRNGTPQQIENAAEIALEHHLGLTCDPVKGLVHVPCIERNGFGAIKAYTAASLAITTRIVTRSFTMSREAAVATKGLAPRWRSRQLNGAPSVIYDNSGVSNTLQVPKS